MVLWEVAQQHEGGRGRGVSPGPVGVVSCSNIFNSTEKPDVKEAQHHPSTIALLVSMQICEASFCSADRILLCSHGI